MIRENKFIKLMEQRKSCFFDDPDSVKRMESFYEIIRIANPDLARPTKEYDPDLQQLLSKFTRIFNIRQILCILKECSVKIKNTKKIEKILFTANQKLSEEFSKKYGDGFFSQMNVYDLMEAEIQKGFGGSKTGSLHKKMLKIASKALFIEAGFQYKWYNYCMMSISMNLAACTVLKNKKSSMEQNISKHTKIWIEYEHDFQTYADSFSDEETEKKIRMNDLFPKMKIRKISFTNSVVKNTITFVDYMKKNNNTAVSETFFALYNPYAKEMEFNSVDIEILAAHIQYFRVANITKILFCMQYFNIDYIFKGYDMTYFLSKPMEVAGKSLENPVCVTEDQAISALIKDFAVLTGKEFMLESFDDIGYLFCSYLNIERIWELYEARRNADLAESIFDKAYLKTVDYGTKIMNEWFESCSRSMMYHEHENRVRGKILDFVKKD